MMDNNELSKELENPVTRTVTLPLRYEAGFDNGPYLAAKDTFSIGQAVIPFPLGDDWAVITRSKFPAISEPPKKLGEHWDFGLSNGYTTFFLSPSRGEGFYWGAGPVLYYPSATSPALGVNKWGSGPSVAFLKKDQRPWVLGAVINNIWSIGGPPGSSDRTNTLLLNPFVSYHFGDGWSVESSPNITADWLSKPGPAMGGPRRGRDKQVVSPRRATREVGGRRLLQCDLRASQSGQLDAAGNVDIRFPELDGNRGTDSRDETRDGLIGRYCRK
jgi:hypothetical protein